jgi:hypothetical protein
MLWKHFYNRGSTRALRENGIVEKQGLASGLCLHPLVLLTEEKIFYSYVCESFPQKRHPFLDLLGSQSKGFIFSFENIAKQTSKIAPLSFTFSPLQHSTLLNMNLALCTLHFLHVNHFFENNKKLWFLCGLLCCLRFFFLGTRSNLFFKRFEHYRYTNVPHVSFPS